MAESCGAAGALAAALTMAAAGCGKPDLDTSYGRRRGAEGGASVNGVGVLADMFQSFGHRVITVTRLTSKLDNYDTIVWAPDDFEPPTEQQREFFEDWLWNSGGGGRTLIYVGRDYDAAPVYWQKVLAAAPPAQALEAARRLAQSRAKYDQRRAGMPHSRYARWFVVKRDETRRMIRAVTSAHRDWTHGVPPDALEIELEGLLQIPRQADIPTGAEDQLPQFDTLLESQGAPLVIRLTDKAWRDSFCDACDALLLDTAEGPPASCGQCGALQRPSQILVVANGSFLLNLPLVNPAHRVLAGKLIAQCRPGSDVAFVESGPGGPGVLDEDPKGRYPTGLEVLTVWPISAIALHFIVLGIVYCVAQFPIFGKPRERDAEPLSDFGKHIHALGDLLQRTRDQQYALGRLRQYQQMVQRESFAGQADQAPSNAKNQESDKNE